MLQVVEGVGECGLPLGLAVDAGTEQKMGCRIKRVFEHHVEDVHHFRLYVTIWQIFNALGKLALDKPV